MLCQVIALLGWCVETHFQHDTIDEKKKPSKCTNVKIINIV